MKWEEWCRCDSLAVLVGGKSEQKKKKKKKKNITEIMFKAPSNP